MLGKAYLSQTCSLSEVRMFTCRVKFGAFYEHLEACHKGQFDRIASGHYARLVRGPSQVFLHLTPDPIKDQTYFLASLYQEQLSKVMFPLGCLTKVNFLMQIPKDCIIMLIKRTAWRSSRPDDRVCA